MTIIGAAVASAIVWRTNLTWQDDTVPLLCPVTVMDLILPPSGNWTGNQPLAAGPGLEAIPTDNDHSGARTPASIIGRKFGANVTEVSAALGAALISLLISTSASRIEL